MLEVDDVYKSYAAADAPALRGVSLRAEKGDFLAIMGPSGCGKSTLLHLVGAMDQPSKGRVLVDGRSVADLGDDELARWRRQKIGFVFQFFNLLPTLTVLENVELPRLLDGDNGGTCRERAQAMLDLVGMGTKSRRFPAELSGGEMQRVAIARALVNEPSLLLADEPTGSLDTENGESVMRLLAGVNRDLGVTLLLATHSSEAARHARRHVHMRDGAIEALTENPDVAASV
ncbi:Lipoprotein-releasing system ATP-binding protein LolD [Planctomycetes bacterium Pan216]|uniref:Lipoprotein-releasing system ATP-binding protein LolD n=1 Tax=Kolteria novifilia TaxID=2527975 RepID=A0A518B9K4_9BACT|nr:Lipoprotein-releasing system ATP-binding protein LolD [Planctomycetes bacterium Pan216]